MKTLSVIIPALNEERCLGATLAAIDASTNALAQRHPDISVELIVVDNDSTDATAEIARKSGATVVSEPLRNISRARNSGARNATGDAFVFIDADTLIPPELFPRIVTALEDAGCAGGAVRPDHRPAGMFMQFYVWCWRVAGQISGMAQGACQFYRRETFEAVGGYDEEIFMGEDVEFYWTVGRHAKRSGQKLTYFKDVLVIPSPRRFDQWPVWKTIVWGNPFLILLLRRTQSHWRGWYKDVPR